MEPLAGVHRRTPGSGRWRGPRLPHVGYSAAMDFNQIDLTGIKPGWGSIWQGGAADVAVTTLPGPLLIVCMDRGEFNEQFIEHGKSVEAVLAVWIDDAVEACLSDQALALVVDTVTGWLAAGGN